MDERITEVDGQLLYMLPSTNRSECGMFIIELSHCCPSESSIELNVPPETKIICIIPNGAKINDVHLRLNPSKLQFPSFHNSLLSPREMEVLYYICEGKTYSDISRELNITTRTVRQHIQNIKNKLGACNCAQAVSIAMAEGLFEAVNKIPNKMTEY